MMPSGMEQTYKTYLRGMNKMTEVVWFFTHIQFFFILLAAGIVGAFFGALWQDHYIGKKIIEQTDEWLDCTYSPSEKKDEQNN